MSKPLTVWVTIYCGKFWKRWEYQTTWPASWETCMQVRKQQLELNMEQQTGSKLGKEYVKAVYCHPAFFFFIYFISWRLITLQYCSVFCHTLTWISHGFTCIPRPSPPSNLPLYPIPVLGPCLFNLYAEYIMRNTGLDEAQAGIKIAGRNINNLRYADDTTLMAEREDVRASWWKWKRRVKKLA